MNRNSIVLDIHSLDSYYKPKNEHPHEIRLEKGKKAV